MRVTDFNVSQVRTAAVCPRVFYFDAEYNRRVRPKSPAITRIGSAGQAETTACGTLFHAAIEKLNRTACQDPEVRRLAATPDGPEHLHRNLLAHIYRTRVDQEGLFRKSAPEQEAFMNVLRGYVGELADILCYALSRGKPVEEILDEGEHLRPPQPQDFHGDERQAWEHDEPACGGHPNLGGLGRGIAEVFGIFRRQDTVGRAGIQQRIEVFGPARPAHADGHHRRDGNGATDSQ